MKGRNPNSEIRRKSELRNPKSPSARLRLSGFGLRVSSFLRISAFGFRIWLLTLCVVAPRALFAATTNAARPDEIPPLRPPHAEIPPTFWEQYSLWVILLGVLLLAALGVAVWLLLRPKPPEVVPPEVQARQALEPLRPQPEDGALLSRISQVLRHYVATAFDLPPGELTTTEFCRAMADHSSMGAELSAALGEFLRQCDQRKFSPPPPAPPLSAAAQALKLVELAEARRAELRRAAEAHAATEQTKAQA
jgi:hypothetical protein